MKHHVKEEEGEMFPKVRATGIDLEQLGAQIAARKEELKKQMRLTSTTKRKAA